MGTTNTLINTVAEIAGEDVIPVVNFLKGRRNISEFKIAEELKLEVNRTRNILYRLFTNNLVTYHRKKDRQKGWYISYWTFNLKGLQHTSDKMKREKLDSLKERLQKEEAHKGVFFLCPNICVRLDFDKATDFSYKCPECGSLLNQQDNAKTIERIREQIRELHRKKIVLPKRFAAVKEKPGPKKAKKAKPKKTPAKKAKTKAKPKSRAKSKAKKKK